MQKKRIKPFVPVILFFVVLNALFISGRNMLLRWGADQEVLIIGNALLFLITFLSYLIARKGLQDLNPHAFVRSVYGGIMVKMFLFLIATLIYIVIYKKDLNKPALFTLMGLYLIYTFMEVSVLTRQLKEKVHG